MYLDILTRLLKIWIPVDAIIILVVAVLLGITYFRTRKKSSQWYFALFLIVYCIAILFQTVVFRPHIIEKEVTYPFWSYFAGFNGKQYVFIQALLNIALFIPVGVFVSCCFCKKGLWPSFLFGISFSSVIEILQFGFEKGLPEFDDIFHNTIGCTLGYYIVKGTKSLFSPT